MKRIISLLAVISILATISLTGASAKSIYEGRPKFGDVNHDGSINLEDVVAVQKHLAKLDGFSMCISCADVDRNIDDNREVTLEDVVYIQKHIANIENKSACGTETNIGARLTTVPVDSETQKRIEDAFREANPSSDFHDVDFYFYGLIGDYPPSNPDSVRYKAFLVNVNYAGVEMPAISHDENIGNYVYHISSPFSSVDVFVDGKYLSIKDAYEQKLIDDEVLDEIAFKLHFTKK